MDFRLIDGRKVELVTYAREYIKEHPDIEIWIGTDSQNKRRDTIYATVVAFYTPGHGAHCIFRRWKTPKERVRSVRLLTEAWKSLETAELIREAGLPKVDYIDLDLNPNPRYKSNEVLAQASGMCEGMGYKVRYKSLGPWSTVGADWLCRL